MPDAEGEDFFSDDNINFSFHWNVEQKGAGDFHDAGFFDYAKPFLPKEKPFRVLEIGCGIAKWSPAWEALGAVYEGVDASKAAIRIAKERYPLTRFHLCRVQDIDPSKFPVYDVIFSHTFLQHTHRATKEKIFPILHKLLLRDGVMVLQENTENGNTATTFTRDGWIMFISDFGFRILNQQTPAGSGNTGMVFAKR